MLKMSHKQKHPHKVVMPSLWIAYTYLWASLIGPLWVPTGEDLAVFSPIWVEQFLGDLG